MNANATDVLGVIKCELAFLSAQLDTYQALFLLEQDRRAALIAEVAPGFFALTQAAMVESILMRVSRLMDPRKDKRYENASFERLFQSPSPPLSALHSRWRAIADEWRSGGKFEALNVLRNKFLAHSDLDVWSARTPGESWISISQRDFEILVDLARQLWGLLRDIHLKAEQSDLLAPAGIGGEHPTRILRCLAEANFLDRLLDRDELQDHAATFLDHIAECVGDETMSPCIEWADTQTYQTQRRQP